jgi:hypothetical protein
MSLRYFSGVEVQAGDHILYHDEAGTVEFVAAPEAEMAWYVEQCGDGCMLAVPSFGLVYVHPDEDLVFVRRRAKNRDEGATLR